MKSCICKITGTGAKINVSIGFRAGFIVAYNEDGNVVAHWSYLHGAGKGQKTYDEGTTETGIAEVTTAGFSEYAGGEIVDSTGALTGTTHVVVDETGTALTNGRRSSAGFTIGTDADINANGEVLEIHVIERGAIATTSSVYTDEG